MTQSTIPFDPDFDRLAPTPEQGSEDSWFTGVSPKLTFIFGLAVGVAVVALLGLLVMWRWW